MGVAGVLLLAASLCVASVVTVDRFGTSPVRPWLANLEHGIDSTGSAALVDRNAPDDVMPVGFWGDQARLSYLLAPWRDRVEFQGPSPELRLVDDRGRVARASFAPAASAPPGPVPDCGYAVEADAPQAVDLEPDLFDLEWVLKVDAYSGSAGTLLVRGERELEVPVPAGLSSHLLVFTGTVDAFELQMAEGSGTACVTGVAVGTVAAAE